MHKLAEKMAECLKAKVEGMGIDNIEGQDLVELGMWVDIIKDISEYDKNMREIEEMDEEKEDGEDGRRYYRGQRRDSRGRYMSRRRGYEEMMPDYGHYDNHEYMRDMDRQGMGRMYYSGSSGGGSVSSLSGGSSSGMSGGNMGGSSGGSRNYGGESGGGRDYREGRSGQQRRSYMETKELHQGNSTEDKQKKMKELEAYTTELGSDITEMIAGASNEEKTMLKTKLQTLAQKIS